MAKKAFFVITVLLLVVMLSSCDYSEKINGGGWLDSGKWKTRCGWNECPDGKATFGFHLDLTDEENPKVNGVYHDHSCGVDLKFTDGVDVDWFQNNGSCLEGELNYASLDPKNRGDGELEFKVCDFGEGAPDKGDTLYINVTSGPYDGYENYGLIHGGNIQDLDD